MIKHFLHLAKGLQFMHRHGVVHGDIKPGNIFVRMLAGAHTRAHTHSQHTHTRTHIHTHH
jgi:serine/threonine protein kinase